MRLARSASTRHASALLTESRKCVADRIANRRIMLVPELPGPSKLSRAFYSFKSRSMDFILYYFFLSLFLITFELMVFWLSCLILLNESRNFSYYCLQGKYSGFKDNLYHSENGISVFSRFKIGEPLCIGDGHILGLWSSA